MSEWNDALEWVMEQKAKDPDRIRDALNQSGNTECHFLADALDDAQLEQLGQDALNEDYETFGGRPCEIVKDYLRTCAEDDDLAIESRIGQVRADAEDAAAEDRYMEQLESLDNEMTLRGEGQ